MRASTVSLPQTQPGLDSANAFPRYAGRSMRSASELPGKINVVCIRGRSAWQRLWPRAEVVRRLITSVPGVSPAAVRIVPALAGGAVVVIAARCAALFGADRFGRVLAALVTACAPVIFVSVHVDNTTPLDLLFWAAVVLCAATALLRGRPRWWLGAGVAAGLGLENDNLMLLLLAGLAIGLLVSPHRQVLRTRWPWAGAAIAVVIWAPNLIWQAANGWPELAMAAALRHENSSASDYAAGLPAQLLSAGCW